MSANSTSRPRRVYSRADLWRVDLQAGDAALLDGDPRRLYYVVGELPNDEFEVVSVAQVRDRSTVSKPGFEDVVEAVGDGRLLPRRAKRSRLMAYPSAIDFDVDLDEVIR